jgi:TRAP-type C4-dicarboxylate transport system permease small subunit
MPLANAVRRLDQSSSRAEDLCLAALHALIAGLVLAAVVFRYILNDPLTWSEELVIVLFGWMIFLGIANAFRVRSHIIIDVVVLFAPRVVSIAFGALATAVTALVLGVLTWYAWRYMVREMPNLTPMLGVSAAWAIAPLVVGSVLSILHLLRNLMDEGVAGALWSDITTRE